MSNYLPLTGGQITGSVIQRNVNNSILDVQSGQGGDGGARVLLIGKDYPDAERCGNFAIDAQDGASLYELRGTPHGELTWTGNFTANNGKDGAFNITTHPAGSTLIKSLASDGTDGAFIALCNKNDLTEYWKGGFRLSTSQNGTDLVGLTNGSLQWCGKNIDIIEEQGDGYIRYSNGLQICWGLGEYHDGQVVSYARAFSELPSVMISGWTTTSYWTISNFTVTMGDGVGHYVSWQAIGRWK